VKRPTALGWLHPSSAAESGFVIMDRRLVPPKNIPALSLVPEKKTPYWTYQNFLKKLRIGKPNKWRVPA
jgi:hypothetical protein